MNYLLRCNACGATAWVRGSFDPSVNALSLDDSKAPEWIVSNNTTRLNCEHEDVTVIDEETTCDEGD